MRSPSGILRLLPALLILLLGSSCAIFSGPSQVLPFAPPGLGEFKQDGIPFADDTAGLIDSAGRLCTPLTSRDQKLYGYRFAVRAFENVEKGPADVRKAAALALARCAAAYADWETDEKKVIAVTQNGMDAANAAGAAEKDPHASYYFAVNLGQQLRLIGVEAVTRLGDVLAALKAAGADPSLEQGGPLRVLGMLYLSAPSWPVGPGDNDEALDVLRKAVERYPSHPQNHLFYAMALMHAGESGKAADELATAANLSRPALWGDYAARWLGEIRVLQARLAK